MGNNTHRLKFLLIGMLIMAISVLLSLKKHYSENPQKEIIKLTNNQWPEWPEMFPQTTVSNFKISPYGKHWSYWEERWSKKDKRSEYYLILDGTRYGPSETQGGFNFSPDGAKWSWSIVKDDKSYIIISGKEYGPFSVYPSPYLIFSPDSSSWAFTRGTILTGEIYIYVSGKKYGPYGEVGGLQFSKNGKTWATIEIKPDQYYYPLISGEKFGPYKGCLVQLSSDGSQWGARRILLPLFLANSMDPIILIVT